MDFSELIDEEVVVLFKKGKKIYEYKILEKIKMETDENGQLYRYIKDYSGKKQREQYNKKVENEDYIFYCDHSELHGFILRQEKKDRKNIVYFGRNSHFIVLYNNYLFQTDERGELGVYYITARNIYTGELLTFKDWLSPRPVFANLFGYGRYYCQDKVNDVYVEKEKLIFKIARSKSYDPYHDIKVPDNFDECDIDTEYLLVVEHKAGKFVANKVFDISSSAAKKCDNLHQAKAPSDIKQVVNSTKVKDNKATVTVNKTKEKYWLAKNGLVRCLNDDCPEECSLDCPIHLQTLALEFLDKKDVAQAARFLLKAVEIEPSFADAWNNLAACYGQMGEHEKAYEAFKKAFELRKKPNSLYGMAVALKNMKAYTIAMVYAKMYSEAYGTDSRISSLVAELSELQLADQINNNN